MTTTFGHSHAADLTIAYSPDDDLSYGYFNNPFHSTQDTYTINSASTSGSSQHVGYIEQFSPLEQTAARPFDFEPQMDLDLLSTQNYHQVYSDPIVSGENSSSTSHGNNELYGGLLTTMDREPTPPPTRPRTRKHSAKKDAPKATGSEETTRQRGRPRLDTRDQTAAERRRTQIRLAQRAYRQRKETTISGLNKRVASLEQTIEAMNKTFHEFNDLAIASGIQNLEPALAERLDQSAETLAELSKNAVPESDGEGEEHETTPRGDVLSSRDVKPQLVKRVSDPGQQRRQPGADAGLGTTSIWGYSPTFDNPPDAIETQDTLEPPIEEVDDVQMQSWDDTTSAVQRYSIPGSNAHSTNAPISPTNQDALLYHLEIPSPIHPTKPHPLSHRPFFPTFPLNKSLPLPKSFSDTETSFARRLIRSSLESAIALLSSPSATPAEIRRFCKYTFCFSNIPRILECLKILITRTTNDNLEVWHAPVYHLGNAGLHYPRVGIDASSPQPEYWAQTGPMGPLSDLGAQTSLYRDVENEQIVRELEIDGEWFDSNDVEQYLRTKGLYLNGQSSIVEVLEDVGTDGLALPELTAASNAVSSPSNTTSSFGGPQSPRNDFVPTNAVLYGNEELLNGDALMNNAVPEINEADFDIDMSDMAGWDFSSLTADAFAPPKMELDGQGFVMPQVGGDFDFNTFPSVNSTRGAGGRGGETSYFSLRRKKWVDVEKFLDTIVPQSVCLGRTPGFRRAAVDEALKSATTEGLGEMAMV